MNKERLKKLMDDWAAKHLDSTDEDLPEWVRHGIKLIKASQSSRFQPGFNPIVSVQPLSAPASNILFYRPRYGVKRNQPEFRVAQFSKLEKLRQQGCRGYGYSEPIIAGSHARLRFAATFEKYRVQIFDPEFIAIPSDDYSVELDHESVRRRTELRQFLLGLIWRPVSEWKSEMHVLGLAADPDIEVVDEWMRGGDREI